MKFFAFSSGLFGLCFICAPVWALEFVEQLPTPVNANEAYTLTVTGGTPPYTWKSSPGYNLGSDQSSDGTNTIQMDSGSCCQGEVVVIDSSGQYARLAVNGEGGAWIRLVPDVGCQAPCRPTCYCVQDNSIGDQWYSEEIEGNFRVGYLNAVSYCYGWDECPLLGGKVGEYYQGPIVENYTYDPVVYTAVTITYEWRCVGTCLEKDLNVGPPACAE